MVTLSPARVCVFLYIFLYVFYAFFSLSTRIFNQTLFFLGAEGEKTAFFSQFSPKIEGENQSKNNGKKNFVREVVKERKLYNCAWADSPLSVVVCWKTNPVFIPLERKAF